MLKVLDLRQRQLSAAELAQSLPRAELNIDAALQQVRPLIEEVRSRGAQALREQAERFDKVRPEHLRVPAQELDRALENLDPQVRQALEIAIEHNRRGHQAQLPTEKITEIMPGGRIYQRWVPVRRVGLYVPGGLAVYPSSVVMNAVAAQVAGVEEIALASPPQAAFGGLPHPTILAACKLLGVTEVYAMGGAGAIGAFAYGAAGDAEGEILLQPVDVVTGPGNIYVAAAKRAVTSVCGIDAEAGTTEIGIVADESANPAYVAADLISQAEHDPAAASVLITHSSDLLEAVQAELARQVPQAKHHQRITTSLQGPQSGAVLTGSLTESVRVANAYGAEHLEIHTAQAAQVASQIRNAGAIFIGDYSPVPLGDYLAGSNHVLPTGGTARYASGLNVMAYIKSVQMIEYDRPALDKLTDPLVALATDEDLPAHGQALLVRREV